MLLSNNFKKWNLKLFKSILSLLCSNEKYLKCCSNIVTIRSQCFSLLISKNRPHVPFLATKNAKGRTVTSVVLILTKILMYIFLGSDQFHHHYPFYRPCLHIIWTVWCIINYIAHFYNGARIIDSKSLTGYLNDPIN